MLEKKWTASDIPSQSGKLAIVTGANSGIGFHTAKELARAGAKVILACRNLEKANSARKLILKEIPDAKLQTQTLNLADLQSVATFSKEFLETGNALHLLVNNAGVMAIPRRKTTVDGFEMQFGTNHLGHFALSGSLMPSLIKTSGSRVITVSSRAHWKGTMYFNDLQFERKYRPWPAYQQSKLANLLFGFELQRRFEKNKAPVLSVMAHPGISNTSLPTNGPGFGNPVAGFLAQAAFAVIGQSDAEGALPTLRAATDPKAKGGAYFGPKDFRETRGEPILVNCSTEASDPEVAEKLWTMSEEMTGVHFFSK